MVYSELKICIGIVDIELQKIKQLIEHQSTSENEKSEFLIFQERFFQTSFG